MRTGIGHRLLPSENCRRTTSPVLVSPTTARPYSTAPGLQRCGKIVS